MHVTDTTRNNSGDGFCDGCGPLVVGNDHTRLSYFCTCWKVVVARIRLTFCRRTCRPNPVFWLTRSFKRTLSRLLSLQFLSHSPLQSTFFRSSAASFSLYVYLFLFSSPPESDMLPAFLPLTSGSPPPLILFNPNRSSHIVDFYANSQTT